MAAVRNCSTETPKLLCNCLNSFVTVICWSSWVTWEYFSNGLWTLVCCSAGIIIWSQSLTAACSFTAWKTISLQDRKTKSLLHDTHTLFYLYNFSFETNKQFSVSQSATLYMLKTRTKNHFWPAFIIIIFEIKCLRTANNRTLPELTPNSSSSNQKPKTQRYSVYN